MYKNIHLYTLLRIAILHIGKTGLTRRGIKLAKVTEEKIAKILLLANGGLSTTAIARALNISSETVRKYKNGGKNGKPKNDKKSRRSNQINKLGGSRDTGPIGDKEGLGELEHNNKDNNAPGEGSVSEGSNGSINFIGGKKTMPKAKKGNEEDQQKDWTCPECGHDFDGQPENCPHCGCDLEW